MASASVYDTSSCSNGPLSQEFLPWKDSKLTYCRLDDDADLVLTGPLDGCSVFVVDITGRGAEGGTYLFHVNANDSGLKGGAAARAQVSKFRIALDRLWPTASERTVTHRLTSDDYRSTSEGTQEGFVYGVRSSSSAWNFFYYFIDFSDAGTWTMRDAMPAPLPRVGPIPPESTTGEIRDARNAR